jgi:hypothetical protein
VDEPRSVSFEGFVNLAGDASRTQFELTLEVQQDVQSAAAIGSLVATDEEGRGLFSSVKFGLLQVQGDWASVSMRVSDEEGVERGGYLVVDGADPMNHEGGATVVIALEGRDGIVGNSDGLLVVR